MEIGLGTMGMSAEDFWDMTPREFHFKMKGYYEREMLKERLGWERCRWSTWVLFCIQTDGKKRITPRDLIEFDWEKDEKKETEPLSKDELERIKGLYERKKHGNRSGS